MNRMKFLCFFVCFIIIYFIGKDLLAKPPEEPPKKWPCDQVYNPKLNLSSIWQGPSIEEPIKNWWKHDDVIEYVNRLADPTLEEEEGVILIEEFAKKYTYLGILKKPAQKEKLVFLFAGLYQKAKDKRNRQYKGILKFVERQENGEDPAKVMDDLGIKRYCCRKIYVSHLDLIDELLPYD